VQVLTRNQFDYPIQRWCEVKFNYNCKFNPTADGRVFVSERIRMNQLKHTMPISVCPITKGIIRECLKEWSPRLDPSQMFLLNHPAGQPYDLTPDTTMYLICIKGGSAVLHGDIMYQNEKFNTFRVESGERLELAPHFNYQQSGIYLVCYE
jgi:hypothetical protein